MSSALYSFISVIPITVLHEIKVITENKYKSLIGNLYNVNCEISAKKILQILFSFIPFYFCHIFFYILFFIFFADEQNIFGIYYHKIIKPLQHN